MEDRPRTTRFLSGIFLPLATGIFNLITPIDTNGLSITVFGQPSVGSENIWNTVPDSLLISPPD